MGYLEDLIVIDNFTQSLIKVKPKYVTKKIVYTFSDITEYVEPWFQVVDETRFFQMVISGMQGTGKTTTALAIAAKVKEYYQQYDPDTPSCIIMINDQALTSANLDYLTSKYKGYNIVFIADDLSYIFGTLGRKESSLQKNMFSRIRHDFEAKMFLIFITHVPKGIPPILRNTSAWCFMSLSKEQELPFKPPQNKLKLFNIMRKKPKHEMLSRVYMRDPDDRVALLFYDNNVYLTTVKKRMVEVNEHLQAQTPSTEVDES